jgi:small redox-active disulfide protein 2
MLDIKVAGPGCKNCMELKVRVARVLSAMQVESTVREIKDYQAIAQAGVMMTPGLIVNGKVVSEGRLLSEEQIRSLLEGAMGNP